MYFIGMQQSRSGKLVVTLLTIVAFLAAQLPMAAFAQNSAQAEVLFKEGKELLQKKEYAAACQRLAASQKLDPSANTQLLLGLCYGEIGKTASAYNAYLDASSLLPKGSDAQKYAAGEASKLESKLVKVRVTMALIPKDVAITVDDEKPRDKDFVGIDMALDPGDHTVTVTAPGKHDYSQHFKLGTDNSPLTLQVSLTDKTQAEIDAENKAKLGGGGGGPLPEQPESWSTVKTLGLVGIIVGGTALVAAGVMQILAFVFQGNATNLQNGANADKPGSCQTLSPGATNPNDPTSSKCSSAVSYHQQALSSQTAAIGVGIGGAVIGIAGLVMFIVGGNVKKGAENKAGVRVWPMIGPNVAGIGLGGSF